MSDISLSKGIRSNLLQLQNTADLIGRTQNRLATGKRVNSALDNPTNFFTSSALNSRANDLSNLLDALGNGIKTLEAADNGLKAITKTVESAQATLRQARQDKSFKTSSYTIDATAIGTTTAKNISFSGGAVGATAVDISLNTTGAGSAATSGKFTATGAFATTSFADAADSITFKISVDSGPQTLVTIDKTAVQAVGDNDTDLESAAEFDAILTAAGVTGVSSSLVGGKLTLTSASTGTTSKVAISNYTETDADSSNTDGILLGGGTADDGDAAVAAGAVRTVDELVTAITANASLTGKIKASNDGGKLRIENLSTEDLSVVGATAAGVVNGGTGGSNTATVGGNEVRKNLVAQFNELRTQLDKLSDDSSFNGVNLLKGDKLKLTFNEIGTSSIEIQAKDTAGNVREISSSKLGITSVSTGEFSDDATIDARLGVLSDALTTLRSQSSTFGSNLSVVQNRTEFTKSTINTLKTGADGLTLADQNEEAANLLSLQTRQQLASTALSLANQADQGVLRLF